MLWCKEHESPKGLVLALADEELMGQSFEEGEFLLAVNNFFKGRLVETENVPAMLESARIINAVGRDAVSLVINANLATEDVVKQVSGIPHMQVFKINS